MIKKRTREILAILDEQYGTEYICYLNYETPWQLLIATIANLKELEQDIKPTGYSRQVWRGSNRAGSDAGAAKRSLDFV